jgi:hypothetical protein
MQTTIQRVFAPLKRYTPRWLWSPLRRVATALFTPALFSWREGHFRSSLRAASVDRNGEPLPWYSYPSIDFLRVRDFSRQRVLEFGAGHSTLWWATRAATLLSIEEDPSWAEKLRPRLPANAQVHLASMASAEACLADVRRILEGRGPFDVIVIDGLYRQELVPVAVRALAEGGIIVCDNSEGYGFREAFLSHGMSRVDFYGMAPGVILDHCTSIYFRNGAFAFDPAHPIVNKYQVGPGPVPGE